MRMALGTSIVVYSSLQNSMCAKIACDEESDNFSRKTDSESGGIDRAGRVNGHQSPLLLWANAKGANRAR